MSRLVFGIGFNDNKYPTKIDGRNREEYNAWSRMLQRCTEKFWQVHPSYVGTTCSDNFKSYSYFYEWYHNQQTSNKIDENNNKWHLDKDLLSPQSVKIYSEDTCVFLPHSINSLLIKRVSKRGECPIGVDWRDGRNKYRAACNIEKGINQHLGYFDSKEDAFQAYKRFKECLVKYIANKYKDQLEPRAYEALMKYQVNISD